MTRDEFIIKHMPENYYRKTKDVEVFIADLDALIESAQMEARRLTLIKLGQWQDETAERAQI